MLRPPRPSDVEDKLRAGRHAEIVRSYGGSYDGRQPSREDTERWYEKLVEHAHAWVIEHEGRAIGEIRLDDLDLNDGRAMLAVGLNQPDLLDQGLGTEAIGLVLGHAFGSLGLHRVGLRVLEFNRRAIRAYEKTGFQVEGREREAALVDGERYDDVMMGVLGSEWQPPER